MFASDIKNFFDTLDFGQIFYLEEGNGSICGYKFTRLRLNKTYQGRDWELYGISGKTQEEVKFFDAKKDRLTNIYTEIFGSGTVDPYWSLKGIDFKPYFNEVFARLANKYAHLTGKFYATSVGNNTKLHVKVWQWANNAPVERYMLVEMNDNDRAEHFIEISKDKYRQNSYMCLSPTSLFNKGANFKQKHWYSKEECIKANKVVVYNDFGDEEKSKCKYNVGDKVYYFDKDTTTLTQYVISARFRKGTLLLPGSCVYVLGEDDYQIEVNEKDLYATPEEFLKKIMINK